MKFISIEHERAFNEITLDIDGHGYFLDTNHEALIYLLTLDTVTRSHINELYSITEDCIRLDGLEAAWQTGTTTRVTRLAFNLWNGFTDEDNATSFTPYELFCCDYAPYFIEAIKILYPSNFLR